MAYLAILHLNGPNGGTSATDDAASPNYTFGTFAAGEITTSFSKLGAGCYDDAGGGFMFFTSDFKTAPSVWTMEMFFKLDSLSGRQGLMALQGFGGKATAACHVASSNQIEWRVSIDGTTNITPVLGTKSDYVIDTWYHIAMSFDPVDNKFYCYVDGVKDAEISTTYAVSSTWGVYIGADGTDLITGGGSIDEFVMTDTTLYPGGITFTVPTTEASEPTNEAALTLPMLTLSAYGGEEGASVSHTTLPLFTTSGLAAPPIGANITAALTLKPLQLDASGGQPVTGTAELELPLFTLSATTGPSARLTLPLLELAASAEAGVLYDATLTLPKLSISAAMENQSIITGNVVLPSLAALGTMLSTNSGAASVELPAKVLLSYGVKGNPITADIILPSLRLTASGYPTIEYSAGLELPMLQLVASGYQSDIGTYRIWAVNLHKNAVTEYTNFDFNSFTEFGGNVLAAGPNGIHIIGEAADDAGTAIDSEILFGNLAYGTSRNKRVPRIYAGYRSDGVVKFTTEAQGQGVREYLLPDNGNVAIQLRRLPIGYGPKSTYWQFGFQNVDGCDFAIDSLILRPDVLRRRVF